jgi:hypothetical protein
LQDLDQRFGHRLHTRSTYPLACIDRTGEVGEHDLERRQEGLGEHLSWHIGQVE